MKKLMSLAVAALALFVAAPKDARSSAYSVEPCIQSRLCSGLVEHFDMQDLSDYARYGAFGSVLHERVGSNIGSGTGKIGNAADLAGSSTSYLWSSTFVPTMSANWKRFLLVQGRHASERWDLHGIHQSSLKRQQRNGRQSVQRGRDREGHDLHLEQGLDGHHVHAEYNGHQYWHLVLRGGGRWRSRRHPWRSSAVGERQWWG